MSSHLFTPDFSNDISNIISFILSHNFVSFNSKCYLQRNGTAMGTKMAPAYANICMHHIDCKLLDSFHLKPIAYFRYIDDIFLIWPHGHDTLKQFIDNANTIHPSIKFTSESSSHELPFLDVLVQLNNQVLSTTV